MEITKEQEAEIEQLLEWGICIDGSHHKQWCLVELAKILWPHLLEDEEYDAGIAP